MIWSLKSNKQFIYFHNFQIYIYIDSWTPVKNFTIVRKYNHSCLMCSIFVKQKIISWVFRVKEYQLTGDFSMLWEKLVLKKVNMIINKKSMKMKSNKCTLILCLKYLLYWKFKTSVWKFYISCKICTLMILRYPFHRMVHIINSLSYKKGLFYFIFVILLISFSWL